MLHLLLAAMLAFQADCFGVAGLGSGDRAAGNVSTQEFLRHFGYLKKINGTGRSENLTPEALEEAISKFQRFAGIEETGIVDEATLKKINSPRCGVADIPSNDSNLPLSYHTPGFRWRKRSLKWKILYFSRTSTLSHRLQSLAIERAFKYWSDITPLTFSKTKTYYEKADIEIKFSRGDHGDGYGNRFDGRGRTLAHAFYPENGDTHFDDDEEWTSHSSRGTDLEIVAAHEFGHALGLGHSNVPKSLMAPYYQGYIPNFSLHWDDVRGIQRLYGGRRRSQNLFYCSWVDIDATMGNQDNMFIFKDKFVITSSQKYKKQLISKIFPNGPSSVDAAVYVNDTGFRKVFLFKDGRTWRYSEDRRNNTPSGYRYKIDTGYPRGIGQGFQTSPDAAIAYRHYHYESWIIFFKDDKFCRWDHLYDHGTAACYGINRFWTGAPTNMDAAMTFESKTLFFKHDKVYEMDNFYGLVLPEKTKTFGAWISRCNQ